jgi:transposase
MRAYSVDLRQRVVAAVDAGTPRAEVARTFGVSLATIKRHRKQRREAGHLAPRTSPGRPPGRPADRLPALEAQLAARPDATLAQHCQQWQEAQGALVSASAMRRAIKRLDWTRKKSR